MPRSSSIRIYQVFYSIMSGIIFQKYYISFWQVLIPLCQVSYSIMFLGLFYFNMISIQLHYVRIFIPLCVVSYSHVFYSTMLSFLFHNVLCFLYNYIKYSISLCQVFHSMLNFLFHHVKYSIIFHSVMSDRHR